jgi:hypothetical protein
VRPNPDAAVRVQEVIGGNWDWFRLPGRATADGIEELEGVHFVVDRGLLKQPGIP